MKKSFLLLIVVAVLAMGTGGCEDDADSADSKQREATSAAMKEAHAQVGMPAIHNFQERKLAKMIFELRDKADLVTYAYIVNLKGELIFIGKCIGFGLPYSVQYTNPMKIEGYYRSAIVAIPQPDPNGLFMPEGLSATWLMMIDPDSGKARPVYIEPKIIVSPFPLHSEAKGALPKVPQDNSNPAG